MEEKQTSMKEQWAAMKEAVYTVYRESYLPALARGMMKGVFKLDEKSKKIVLKEVAAACAEFVRGMHQQRDGTVFPKGTLDIDKALEFITHVSPHRRTYKRVGDTIHFTTHMKETYGECICPLVILGIVDSTQGHCYCSAEYFKQNLEYLTGKPLGPVEVVKTMCMGDSYTCDMIIKLKPAPRKSRQKK